MADLMAWLAKRVGIPLVLATFGVSISLIAALVVWALPAFYAPPSWMAEVSPSKIVTATWQAAIAIGLVIGGIAGAYKFDLFREGKPHLTIDLTVSSRPINSEDTHVGVVAQLHNTSKVMVRVENVDWEIAMISPYPEEYLTELIAMFHFGSAGHENQDETEDNGTWREFPWWVLDSHSVSGFITAVEPGETDQITHDFIVPVDVDSVAVSVHVKNMEEDEAVWSRREVHDIKESADV